MSRHRLFLWAGVTLAAVLLSSGFLYKYSQDHARVLRFSGSVSIERAGERIPVVVGTLLSEQDKITTGSDAFLEVAYDDTHRDVLRIGSDSNVVLESAVIEKQTNIFMDKGEIILKLEKLEKGSTFKVRTPAAIAGVRGTSFGVRLTGNQAVITDYESKIFVKGLNKDFTEMNDELLLSEGWKVCVTRFEKPSQVERITPQELVSWQAWLDELAFLSRGPSPENGLSFRLASFQTAIAKKNPAFLLSAVTLNVTSSASFLAFMLYTALAANLGRVFLHRI